MAESRRYFVRSPDGSVVAGYDGRDIAACVALEYGDGAHLVDTLAQAYHPMVEEVIDGALVYLEYGGWDTGRHGVDRDLIDGLKKGHVAIVHAFLEKGADPNAVDADGGPALLWAVARGNPEVVSLLLARGADPGVRDAQGNGARDIAERRGRAEILEILKRCAQGG